jgi:hypothetical protein
MAHHAMGGSRQDLIFEAEFLNRHGYGVLLASFRAHEFSDGETTSFGYHERKDMDARYNYLVTRDDIDVERVGVLGESTGAATSIQFLSENEDIKAMVAVNVFSLTPQLVFDSLYSCGRDMPDWLATIYTPLVIFWAQQEADFDIYDINAVDFIGDINSCPVFIVQGNDQCVGLLNVGHQLYDAADQPKDIWIALEAKSGNFEEYLPEEYEQRIVDFFDRYLLEE